MRQHLRLPLLTAIGNHDLEKGHGSWLYRQIFGPDYYAFQIKGNYFIMVNDVEPKGVGEAQWRWLERQLQKAQGYKSRLVFLHIPLFDPGAAKTITACQGTLGLNWPPSSGNIK